MKRLMAILGMTLAFAAGLALGPLLHREVAAQISVPLGGPAVTTPLVELAVPSLWGRAVGYAVGPNGGVILFEAADGTLRQWVVAGGTSSHVIRRN